MPPRLSRHVTVTVPVVTILRYLNVTVEGEQVPFTTVMFCPEDAMVYPLMLRGYRVWLLSMVSVYVRI